MRTISKTLHAHFLKGRYRTNLFSTKHRTLYSEITIYYIVHIIDVKLHTKNSVVWWKLRFFKAIYTVYLFNYLFQQVVNARVNFVERPTQRYGTNINQSCAWHVTENPNVDNACGHFQRFRLYNVIQ